VCAESTDFMSFEIRSVLTSPYLSARNHETCLISVVKTVFQTEPFWKWSLLTMSTEPLTDRFCFIKKKKRVLCSWCGVFRFPIASTVLHSLTENLNVLQTLAIIHFKSVIAQVKEMFSRSIVTVNETTLSRNTVRYFWDALVFIYLAR